jgi:hypothetical protein
MAMRLDRLDEDELVLLMSVTGDYSGLWEIPHEFIEAAFPDCTAGAPVPDNSRNAVVEWIAETYNRLLANELITVFRGTNFTGEEQQLSDVESKNEVSNLSNYDYEHIPDVHVRVLISQKALDSVRTDLKWESLLAGLRRIWCERWAFLGEPN